MTASAPRTITRDELVRRRQRGDDLVLVAVLAPHAFRLAHIPGSIHFRNAAEAMAALDPERPIVLYCTGYPCVGSAWAYRLLAESGYRHLWLYSGGLQDWQAAGLPVEGA